MENTQPQPQELNHENTGEKVIVKTENIDSFYTVPDEVIKRRRIRYHEIMQDYIDGKLQ